MNKKILPILIALNIFSHVILFSNPPVQQTEQKQVIATDETDQELTDINWDEINIDDVSVEQELTLRDKIKLAFYALQIKLKNHFRENKKWYIGSMIASGIILGALVAYRLKR